MKKCLPFLFTVYCLSFMGVSAQTRKADSLLHALKTAKEDTNKVIILDGLCDVFEETGSLDSAIMYGENGLKLAEKLEYKKGIASLYINTAYVYYDKGNYSKALYYDSIALAINTQLKAKKGIAAVLGNIGIIYDEQGKYPQALEYQLKALSLNKESGNKYQCVINLCNIGVLYDEIPDYDKALEYDMKALDIAKELKNNRIVASILCNIGTVYHTIKKYEKSLQYDSAALDLQESLGNKFGTATPLSNMGANYQALKQYRKALEFDFKALAISKAAGDKSNIAIDFGSIGIIYLEMEKYKEAKALVDSAIIISKSIGEKNNLKDEYFDESVLDSAASNYKAALEDYKTCILYSDSLENDANTKKTVQAEMNFDFAQKQAAEKAAQDKKDAIAMQDRKKQEVIRNSFIAGFALMLALAFFIFRGYRQKQKANEIITQQKEEVEKQKILVENQKSLVEEKNKDILDSITYAKRLQDAILPPLSVIKQYLPESFVLYKPKDIVAGDFYWLERAGDTVLIAAADCTGHGVPGALVSVVCSNALNRTVKEFKITEPGRILDKVRELVLETFEKSESNVQDGMDISLVAITASLPSKGGFEESSSDKNTNLVHGSPLGSGGAVTVQWSGANNSLWYIQNGEMKEIAPDKQPIGKYYNAKPFTTHSFTIPISPLGSGGATLYLFTDGYADQFGGPKGKKFKYKQMEEKLVAISHQSMAEQKNILEQTFEEWKGSLEQVDDVLVIGIRV